METKKVREIRADTAAATLSEERGGEEGRSAIGLQL